MELPVSFADYTRTLLGDEDYKELVTSLESEQSVSIRLNPLKPFAFRSGEHAVPGVLPVLPERTPDIYF